MDNLDLVKYAGFGIPDKGQMYSFLTSTAMFSLYDDAVYRMR